MFVKKEEGISLRLFGGKKVRGGKPVTDGRQKKIP